MKTKFFYIPFLFLLHFSSFSQLENRRIGSKKLLKTLRIEKYNLNLIYFLEPSCPVSQKYQSVIAAINNEFQINDLNSVLIFPATFSSQKEIVQFAKEIDPKSKVIFDANKKITKKIGAKITPEVFLINAKGEIEYHGAIDNWYYQLGKNRIEPSQHYLRNAIKNYLLKYPIIPKFTNAIGCDIE